MDSSHIFLVSGENYPEAKGKVEHFLTKNLLVRYSALLFDDEKAMDNLQEQFFATIRWAEEQNVLTLQGLLSEFVDLGYDTVSDLSRVPQGYESKLLHTVTHLLDGFFGLDSFFYNLVEDSNRISTSLLEKIGKHMDKEFFLVHVQGSFRSLDEADQIPNMRRLGVTDEELNHK